MRHNQEVDIEKLGDQIARGRGDIDTQVKAELAVVQREVTSRKCFDERDIGAARPL